MMGIETRTTSKRTDSTDITGWRIGCQEIQLPANFFANKTHAEYLIVPDYLKIMHVRVELASFEFIKLLRCISLEATARYVGQFFCISGDLKT